MISRTAAALQARRQRLATRHDLIGKTLHVVNDDQRISGSLLAAGVAFRLFLMTLPLALLLASGFGFASSDGRPSSTSGPTRKGLIVAMAQVIGGSGAEARRARWVLLVAGVMLLLWAATGAAQSISRAYALVWRVPRQHGRAAIITTLAVSAGLVTTALVSLLATAARDASFELGVLAMMGVLPAYFAIWLLVSRRLPREAPTWDALIPGALLFAVGWSALQLLTVFFIARRLSHASHLYGSLGVVSTAMFWLFLGGRLIVASAGVNATLWRRQPWARDLN